MSSEGPRRFELFVRSLEPATAAPAHERTVEELAELASTEDVSFDLHVWGDCLPLDSACAQTRTATELHDRVRELREWASEHDVDLPAFERVRTNTLVGPSREALTLPPLLLAAYSGEELVAVAPRVEDGEHFPVTELLAPVAGQDTVAHEVTPSVSR